MYLKNREKKDVDFLVTGDDSLPERMVEVKLSDGQLSANLAELEYIRQPVIVDTSEEKLEVEVYVCNKVMSADNVEATQGDFVKFLRAI